MGIVLKVVHADNSVGTIELGSDSKVVFKPGDRVDVKNIKNLKDVEIDKDGNVVLTFPDGKVVLSNLPKEQLDALIAQLPPDEVSTASNPVSGKAMTGLLLLSLQSMLKTGGGLEFNTTQSLSGNAVKLDFGASPTSSDTKTSSFASLAPSGISLSASFVSVINGKEEATSVEDTITGIKASLTVTNPVLKDVTFVEQSAVKGDYGAFSISKSGDWTYQLNNASQKVQALSAGETVTDTFTVASSDGSAATDVRVVIAGTNDAPVLAAGRISTTEKAASARLDLSKLASDIDSDDDPSTLRYSIVGQPDKGSASISGTKLTFAPGSDFASLQAGETLTETIKVRVTDSHGATADNVVTVTVSGVADAPVLRGGGFSITEDESKTMALSSFVVSSGVADRALDFTITSQPDASTAAIVNGNLVFTPGRTFQALEFGETRQVEVGLRGTNAAGLSTDTTVRYTVVGMPDKPIPSLVSRTVDEDSSPISVDIMSIVSDRSHNPNLTFRTEAVTGGGHVSLSQTGILTFDPNGAFNNLAKGQSATVSVDVRVESPNSGTVFIVPVEFTITGADDAPVLRGGGFSITEDESKTMALSSFVVSSGVADRAIDFTITSQPEASTAAIVDGNLVFTPGRTFQALEFGETRQVEVGLRGTNAAGLSTDTTVRYTVVGMPDKPIPSLVSRTVNEDSSPIAIDIMSIVSDRSHNPDLTFRTEAVTGGGRVSVSESGILTFDPNGAFNNLTKGQSATVSLDVRVESPNSGTVFIVPVEFTVTGADDAPVLRGGGFSITEDESQTMALSGFVVSSGVADRALDFTITSQPEASTAAIVNGNLVFTPGRTFQALEFGETRQVEVGLRGTNAAGLSTDTTVRYTVVGMPDKPIPSLVSRTVNEDSSPISIDIMSIVSDRSHNPDLTFRTEAVTGGGRVSLSQTGILTFDPNGAFNNLAKGQSATVSVDVRVESPNTGTVFIVPVEFTITGANEVPIVIDGHLDAVENGATVAMKLMSLVKTTGLDDGLAPKFAIVEQPEKGLASIANGQLVFNPAKGFDDLAKGESRDVDVTVRVTNSQGETADATVTVTVTGINDAPTISDKAVKITESASATIDVASLAGDVDSDDNANTLTYAVTGEPKLGSASLKGTTLSFETGNGFESLSKGETRSVEIDLSATDRHGLSGKGTVTITVTGENDAPILSAARLSAAEDGASVALDLAKLASDIDTDDDGKTLTYSIVKGPLEGTVKLSGTSLIFDPGQGFQSLEDGQTRDVTVVVRATDHHGASADATITVTITGQYDGETVLLSNIAAGEGGFRIVGERAGDMAGLSVSSAGDFNGDGFDDFIIGAPGNDATGGPGDLPATLTDHGAVYVVYGQQQRPDQINLDDIAAGRGGFKIVPGSTIVRDPFGSPAISPDANHLTGMSVAAAGDVNGDGFADILVGGPGSTQLRFDGSTLVANPGIGGAYVLFGQATTIGSVNLDDIGDAVSGFRIEGESVQSRSGPFLQSVTGIFAGMDVASAGDVNGDGLDDLLIGSRDGAYIVLGQAGETTVNLDAVADGIGGFKVTFPPFSGSANVLGGVTVSALGDIDKDGFDDVAVGSNFGVSRIIYGSATLGASGNPAISSITVEGASLRPGETTPSAERALITISALGDINGDGIDDFMVGVPSNAEGGAQAGAAYVVFGREGGRSDLSLTDIANGIGGFKITGEAAGNAAGISVAAAGDMNGDGFTDMVIGASTDRNLPLSQLGLNLLDEAVAQAGSGSGSAYVVYGTAHAPSEVNLDTIAQGIGGFKLVGEAGGDHAGIAVASAGDIDGDGFDDLLVGANLNDAGGADAGAAYVVYGGFSLPNDTDHAHISGDLDGDVIGSRVETATGRLTATFADGRSEGFAAATRQGDYGSFTLLADGSWTYRLDPENASVKALTFGKTLAESFKVTAEDGSAIAAVAIDIKAPPPVTGDLTASLIEDYRLTASGTIAAQGTAQFVPLLQVQGVFGTFDLTADGHWHYQLDPFSDAVQALLPGDDAIERFAVATTDGAGVGTVTLHIDGTFDFSTFGGDRTARINEDAPGAAGTVKAIDRYAGALEYLAKDVQGVYGTFHLGSNGAWTYDLDNDKAAVRSLATGATLTEQFVVSEAEGRFTQAVSIQIVGANDAPVVTAINAGTVGEDDAAVTIDLLAGQSDEETTALSAVSITVKDNLGHAVTFVDNGNGTIRIDPAQFDALRNGESRTLTVSYAVSDGTTSTANTATLTVNGFADQTTPVANDDTISANVQTGEFLVNSKLASDQFSPAVTALSNGGFVVTWIAHDYPGNFPDFSSIKAQIFDAGGVAVGAEFLVNAQTNTYREVPAVTALTNGGFVITWQNDEQVFNRAATEIRAQIFAADGSPVGNEFLVNSQTNDTQQAPDITALTGGGFVITWHSYDGVEDQSEFGVKAQIFDAGGAPVGDEFLVNTRTDSNQTSPAITALSTGGFVITWESYDGIDDASDYEIRAQIFDATGAAVGGEHLVNTRTANGQNAPDVTALSTGGFVITWTSADNATDTSGNGIKAQIFDARGDAVGSEFIVNNQMADDQTSPAITALSNGGFVIAWESRDRVEDASGFGIKARLFDASGTAVSEEFLVNTDTESSQRRPAIAALADGGFVITWQGLDASASGIKAQIYDAEGNPARADLSAGTVHTITVASLLGNDTDGDGDALAITGVSPTSALGAAVVLNGDGTISIDPRSVTALHALGTGERLADTFTYTISDGHGGTDTATVNLTYRGVNDVPNVVAIDAGAVSEDDAVATINLLAGQTDAENSTLSVRNITAIDNLGHTVALVDHGDGTIGIDPAQFNALDFDNFRDITIAYTVSDGVVDVPNTATLRVQGYNDAAEITGTITGLVREDGQLSTSGRMFVTDPDDGQSSFDTQSLSPGLYGSIAIDADGNWTYQLDNWRPEVQALNNGDVLTDEIYIPTVDGTMTMITIAVQGTDEPGVGVIEAPAQILLSSIAGSPYGLKIVGGAFGDRAGYSVSSAGDFNGDGVDDMLVSAMYGGNFGGRVAASAAMVSDGGGGQDTAFILFGGYSLGGTIDLADVGYSIAGVRITAESDTIQNGITVASLGDFNGDGLDDIAIGAHSDHEAGYSAGAAYVIYGTTEAPQTLKLSEIAGGDGGFKILGENDYDTAGTSVSAAGDINGDGYADVIIGAPNNSSTADYSDSTGAAYVVFGSRDRTSTLDLQLMQKGSEGFKIAGEEPYQLAGYAVSSAGDFNQDGYGDYVIGAYGGYSNGFYKGAAYLVYGSGNSISSIDLEQLGFGVGGFKIAGVAEFDETGFAVASAGDVNGDGLDDFLIGAPFDAPYYGMVEGAMAGKAYVVYGRGDVPYGVDLEHMTLGTDGGTRSIGLRIIGEDDLDRAGVAVSSAGDINGDGLADILVGAPGHGEGRSEAGAAYVIFGESDRTGDIHLSDIAAGKGGFKLVGEAAGDVAGSTVAAAGDVNGDGFDDLIVGARGNDVTDSDDRGAAYVLFGGTYLGGQDYRGNGSDDTISISNTAFTKIDGKSGFDTLLVQGTDMMLDFTKLAQDRVSSIEMIDMTGHGHNSLKLTAEDVFDMSQAIDGDTTSLVVRLDTGDTIDLSEDGWTSGGTRVEGGRTYDLFTNSNLGLHNVDVLVARFEYNVD